MRSAWNRAAPLVCHINLDRGYRGGERQTELLIRELADKGWHQRLVHRRGAVLAERLAGTPGLQLRACGGLLSAARCLAGADLVHVHQGRAIYPAWLAGIVLGIPYLVTRRVPNPPSSGWLTRKAYRGAQRLVCISSAVAGDLGQALGLSSQAMPVIEDGFLAMRADAQASRLLRRQWGEPDFVVGHVGALDDKHKGQADLIAVARALSASHPQVHFVLVGAGRDEARFREQSQGLANLHLAGFVERVGDYMGAFDLFAFPSREEGMGSVLLDAMDRGLAVVATRVGGIPELVAHGETGLLVEPGQPQALGESIVALYQDPQRRERMGQAGRERSRLFTARVMADRYAELYRDMMEEAVHGD